MNAATVARRQDLGRLQRQLVTPEGLSLPLTLASRGARAGALLLDLMVVFGMFILLAIVFVLVGIGFGAAEADVDAAGEVLVVLLILAVFFFRYGYFLFFELGPRGATPGKRALGIRVSARPTAHGGGRLTAEAVIARNLMRDIEVFIPAFFLLSGSASDGVIGIAAFVWLAVFVLFPCFNKDNLRAGDLVAGTWVVEAERKVLPKAMSLTGEPVQGYRFGEAELAVYGEHELQVLEGVLRQNNPQALRQVLEAICRKIGWEPGSGDDDRAFLEAFYAAQRARLEGQMRFGKRKKDKFDAA